MSEAVVHVVDDDTAVRHSTALMLELHGFLTRQWATGDALLDQEDLGQTGCILLDLRMPGLDGLGVMRELRRRGIHLPVILVTGHGDDATAGEAMQAHAFAFLEKPYDETLLVKLVSSAIAGGATS